FSDFLSLSLSPSHWLLKLTLSHRGKTNPTDSVRACGFALPFGSCQPGSRIGASRQPFHCSLGRARVPSRSVPPPSSCTTLDHHRVPRASFPSSSRVSPCPVSHGVLSLSSSPPLRYAALSLPLSPSLSLPLPPSLSLPLSLPLSIL